MRFPWSKKTKDHFGSLHGISLEKVDPIKLAIVEARDVKLREMRNVREAQEKEWDKSIEPILKTIPELVGSSDGYSFIIRGLPQEQFFAYFEQDVYVRTNTAVGHLVDKLTKLGMHSRAEVVDSRCVLRVYL